MTSLTTYKRGIIDALMFVTNAMLCEDLAHYIFNFLVPNPETRWELIRFIDNYVENRSLYLPIGLWNVSKITDFSHVFSSWRNWSLRTFNEDISLWDVSKAVNMASMFFHCFVFNGDLSRWNVGAVTNMDGMFYNCPSFDQDLSPRNVAALANVMEE